MFNCVFLCAHVCHLCYLCSANTNVLLVLCVTMMVGDSLSSYSMSCKTAFDKERTSHLNSKPHNPLQLHLISMFVPTAGCGLTFDYTEVLKYRCYWIVLTRLKVYNDAKGNCYWEGVWVKWLSYKCCNRCTSMGTCSLDAGSPHLHLGTSICLSILFLLAIRLHCSNRTTFPSPLLSRLAFQLTVTQKPRT